MLRNHQVVNAATNESEIVSFSPEEEAAQDVVEAEWLAAAPDRAFSALRYERNMKLAETDWRFRSDLSPSQEWINYSQSLRDLPAQYNNETILGEITWPTAPE